MSDFRPRPRRRWLAALLSLFPGVGHLYAGSVRAAGVILLCEYAIAIALFWLGLRSPWGLALAVGLSLAWRVLVARSAMRYARDAARSPWRPHMAVTMAVCLVALIVIVGPLGGRVLPVATMLGGAYRIPSEAMSPTLIPGDFITTRTADASALARDELIVLKALRGQQFVQRVVALAGDTVEMRDAALWRNGRLVNEPYAWRDTSRAEVEVDALADLSSTRRPTTYNWGPIVVPAGHFVALGDNRGNSLDSRYLGFFAESSVTQRPQYIYFSKDSIAGVRWERIGRRLRRSSR